MMSAKNIRDDTTQLFRSVNVSLMWLTQPRDADSV